MFFRCYQPCWVTAADTLVRELDGIEVSWPLMNTGDIRAEIGTVLYAMTSLSTRFPLLSAFFLCCLFIRPNS
jgi:hypothetical protein